MKIPCMQGNFVKSKRWQLHAGLVLAQIAFSGFEVLSRVAFRKVAGIISFSLYRNLIATFILGVLAYYREKKKRPALTLAKFCMIFLLGFIGVTLNQVFYLVGLNHTSAIYASALRNITPVLTFIIAVVCRMESVRITRLDGFSKVTGSILATCGSIMLPIFKVFAVERSKASSQVQQSAGPSQTLTSRHVTSSLNLLGLVKISMDSWHLGTLFLVVSCVVFALFLILQAPMMKNYPAPISFITLACFSSIIQLPILGAIYERRWSSWRIVGVPQICSVFYAGIIASGFVSAIQSWGVYEAGPVIVAAYQPLETVLTALLGYIFLKETLPLGSILGGLVVVIGLYLLIWGQERELKLETQQSSGNLERSVSQANFQLNGSSPTPDKVAVGLQSNGPGSAANCQAGISQT